jgi:hypothetical protein
MWVKFRAIEGFFEHPSRVTLFYSLRHRAAGALTDHVFEKVVSGQPRTLAWRAVTYDIFVGEGSDVKVALALAAAKPALRRALGPTSGVSLAVFVAAPKFVSLRASRAGTHLERLAGADRRAAGLDYPGRDAGLVLARQALSRTRPLLAGLVERGRPVGGNANAPV